MPQVSMLDIFDQCQEGMQCHNKLIKAITKIKDSTEFDVFWSEFVHYLKYSMVVFKREAAVERTIDFVAKFIASTVLQEPVADEEMEAETMPTNQESNKFLLTVFDFLIQSHSAKERAVRFRCCQLINKLLSNLGDNAQIDDDLYDKIYTSMLERLRDKVPVVRMHAVLALSRLQDPTDDNCPVIKAYLFLLSRDPNPDVRRAVLSCIAPSTKTLLAIIERTRDVKDSVRRVAYNVIAEKIHIKALSIAQRIQLLQDGLGDRADMVKEACATKLLQAWLLQFQGSALQLLQSLDVEQSADVCQQVLQKLFEKAPVEEIVMNFDLLDEENLLPEDKLTCESAMYWRVLCQFVHEKGTTYEEQLDKVLPSCVVLCRYVKKFKEKLSTCGDDFDRQLELEYMGQQILSLFKYMDLSDQAGRRELERLLHDLLMCDYVSHALVKHIISTLHLVKTNPDTLIAYLAETISEIREPITVVEKSLNKDERRQLDIKIANVRVRLNQTKEELEECVRNQEFARAAELKKSVSELDLERSSLLEQGESVSEEIRTEKNDPFTILKCLTVISESLTQLAIKTLTPTLHMLLESQVLPGVQNAESDVRNAAVKALGLCCLLKEEVVMQYLPLLIEVSQHDTETVKTTALSCLFDLVHMFGLGITKEGAKPANNDTSVHSEMSDSTEVVTDSPDDTMTDTTKKSDASTDIASKLVAILSAFLDSESSELRTVAAEGLAKLLLSGRVVSSKLLSHLLLLWYNPLTEDDNHLRHCLGAFLPVFAFACRANQELFEEAFMPTLKTLLNAPTSSPLNEVNAANVGDFLLQLVNTKLLMVNQNSQTIVNDNPGHDQIAVQVSNEVLSNPDSFNVKLWTRMLNQLDLTPDNRTYLKDMQVLCDQMLEVVKEKQSVKSLEKFKATVDSLLSTDGSTITDTQPVEESTNTAVEKDMLDDICAVTASQDTTSSKNTDTTAIIPDSQSTVATSVDISSVVSDSQGSDVGISIADGLTDSQSTQGETTEDTATPVSQTSSQQGRIAPPESTRKTKSRSTRAKSLKTPAPTLMPDAKKTTKSTTGRRTRAQMEADSELENSVFGSPTPLRGSKAAGKTEEGLEHTRRNLRGLLLESKESQAANEGGNTPARSKWTTSRTLKRTALTDVNGE